MSRTGVTVPADLPEAVHERVMMLLRRRELLVNAEPMAAEAVRISDRVHELLGLYSLQHRKAATKRRRQQERKDLQTRGLAPGDARHGTLHGYTTFGCRCDDCTRARRDYEASRA